jgi:hypothetical protein
VADFVVEDDDSNFLIGTLYNAPGGNDSLVNGEYSVILGNTGTVTLPAGGTISEGVVTSNPTIQLTPASPEVASQKLVIKGGGGTFSNFENGIDLSTNNNVWEVSDSAEFFVYDSTRADETLYWWIVPEEGGISTTMSGTVELDETGFGTITFTVISDAYEFRVRVSPEEDNYDPESIGVESVLMNGDAPAYGDYHLHLTTGDLTETSIFLGTDDHNVRTTVDGKIQITTPDTVNNVWEFDANGALTIPGDIRSEGNINIDINLSDSTLRRWSFGEDGNFETPGDINAAGNVTATGNITSTGTITGNILKIEDGVHEKFQELADATGTVTHDCSAGNIFYHSSPDANWTVNLTNLNLSESYATTVTIIIDQGNTGYYPSALQVGGAAQTINWQGNTTPTPSTNRLDVVSFSILAVSGGYIVFGQLTGF